MKNHINRIIGLFFLFIALCAHPVEGAENTPKKTVCLNMIVKNESKVIERCLKSAKPLIDYWVIVDTGSTDGTQEIIREYMKDIPGELHEKEWVNFGFNRNHALDLARDKADYVLFIDADEEFVRDNDFKMPLLDKDYYYVTSDLSGTLYKNIHLISTKQDWKWEGEVHEVLVPNISMSYSVIPGLTNIIRFEGCVSQDPNAFHKDAKHFEMKLLKNPIDTRSIFYLARSYEETKKWDLALANYQRRIQLGGWPEEVFWSKYRVAQLQETLEYEPTVFLKSYYDAYTFRPSRVEPLYHLAEYYWKNKRYAEGYVTSKLGLEQMATYGIPDDLLFVEGWIYKYGMKLTFSICAYWVGNYEEAKKHSLELLEIKNLPENYRECVEKNLYWINLNLGIPTQVTEENSTASSKVAENS